MHIVWLARSRVMDDLASQTKEVEPTHLCIPEVYPLFTYPLA